MPTHITAWPQLQDALWHPRGRGLSLSYDEARLRSASLPRGNRIPAAHLNEMSVRGNEIFVGDRSRAAVALSPSASIPPQSASSSLSSLSADDSPTRPLYPAIFTGSDLPLDDRLSLSAMKESHRRVASQVAANLASSDIASPSSGTIAILPSDAPTTPRLGDVEQNTPNPDMLSAEQAVSLMSYTWTHKPLVHMPALILLSRFNAVWFGLPLIAVLGLWFALVPCVQYNDHVLLVFTWLALLVLLCCALNFSDYATLRLWLHQFEPGYLVLHLILFLVPFGAYSMSPTVDDANPPSLGAMFTTDYWFVTGLLALLIVALDAQPLQSRQTRLVLPAALAAIFIHLLVVDRTSSPLLRNSSKFCYFFCTDTRNMALIGLSQLAVFIVRVVVVELFSYKPVQALHIPLPNDPADAPEPRPVTQGQFLCLTLPISCSLHAAFPPKEPDAMIRINSVMDSNLFVDSVSSSGHSGPHRLASAFTFRPVNPFAWCRTVATSQIYFLVGGLVITAYFFFAHVGPSLTLPSSTLLGINIALSAAMVVIMLFESVRFDRTLLCAVWHEPLWWVTFAWGAQSWSYVVAAQSQSSLGVGGSFAAWVGFFFFFCLLICSDAAPAYPFKVRVAMLLLAISHTVYILAIFYSDAVSDYWPPTLTCSYLYCSDLRTIAFSGLCSVAYFLIYFLVRLTLHRNWSIILRTHIAYSVVYIPVNAPAPPPVVRPSRANTARARPPPPPSGRAVARLEQLAEDEHRSSLSSTVSSRAADSHPDAWASVADENGVEYFYNRVTGLTTWELPANVDPRSVATLPKNKRTTLSVSADEE